jgi:hypothetical protein
MKSSSGTGNETVSGNAADLKNVIAGKIKGGSFGLGDIPEYLELLVASCNTHPKIQKKSRKANLVFQFQVEGGPAFWIRIDRSRFSTGQGGSNQPRSQGGGNGQGGCGRGQGLDSEGGAFDRRGPGSGNEQFEGRGRGLDGTD